MKIKTLKNKGFTLIELLVVIGILAVLLAITLIAINPSRQFAQANDTQRKSDVNAILNAVHQYMVDNNGTLPSEIQTTSIEIGTYGANICSYLVNSYLAALPVDPQSTYALDQVADCTVTHSTDYFISRSSTNYRVTVAAPLAENSTIEVTR